MSKRVVLDNVLIVRQTEMGWFCNVDSDFPPTFIGQMQIAPGTVVPDVGQRGRVTLTLAAADDLGIAGRGPKP